VEEQRHLRQQKCPRSPTWEKAIDALKRLGFREADARRAVAVARETHGELLSVESALRHTLRALAKTPAVTRPPPKLVA
jgi:Holliday junction resolvasome RuvABC DNA-binding subunit